MASVLMLAVVSLIAFYTTRLQQERTEAQAEAAKATRTAEFLQELFEVSDPSRSKGETVTARELLDQGATRIERLQDQPAVQASMMDIIGNVYRTLALYEEAESLLLQALSLRQQLSQEQPHAETAQSLQSLGTLRDAQGDAESAERLQRQALAMWSQVEARDSLPMAKSYADLGSALFSNGDYAAAEEAQRQALAIYDRLEQGDSAATAIATGQAFAIDQLAAALHEQGIYDQAEGYYRKALDLKEVLFGEDSLQVADSYSNLGNLLRFLDRASEAEDAHRKSLGDPAEDPWPRSSQPHNQHQ